VAASVSLWKTATSETGLKPSRSSSTARARADSAASLAKPPTLSTPGASGSSGRQASSSAPHRPMIAQRQR